MTQMVPPKASPSASPTRAQTSLGLVEYTDVGAGPAFLALHGGMGGQDQSWLLARALLGDPGSRRVIAVSRPGYLSTPTASGASFADQADLYAALLDHLGIDRAVVAAVSAGGPSALLFAARHPARCAGLILVSTPSGRMDIPDDVVRRLRQFGWLCRIPALFRFLAWMNGRHPEKAAIRSIRDPQTRARALAHPVAGPLMAELQRSIFEQLAARLPGTLADTIALADLPPLPLGDVIAPTLVIHGEADTVVPFAQAERSAREIAGASLFAVPAGEHVSLFTHIDAVRSRVSAFLETLDS